MSQLRIAPGLVLPDDVVTSTLVVYGGKGMGKTNFGSVLVEELTKARLRWCVLDPMGVWWGLRHSKDGKGPGIECVILGGAHGDIPIEPTGGAIVADLVVDERVNTIIDFSRKSNGQMWTVGEKVRFVTEYTLRLFQRQGELVDGRRREPMIQILDESARYIPQTIPSGNIDIARCVGAWEQVCEEGRNIGLGVGFLTQRSARMNKSVSELADVMVAFRTIGPNSLNAIMDWLGEHVEKARIRDLASQVRELNVGQALIVSPGWLRLEKVVQIRERETYDSSATPKPGQRTEKVSGEAAKPDLAKYQARMVATIERAKADDPKTLQKRIRELEGELKTKGKGTAAPAPDPAAVRLAIDAAVAAARAGWTRTVGEQLRLARTEASSALRHASESAAAGDRAVAHIDLLAESVERKAAPLAETMKITRQAEIRRPAPARAIAPSPGGIGRGEQRVLDALAELAAMGIERSSRAQAGAVAGLNLTGGSGSTYVGSLVNRGFIAIPGPGELQLTESGQGQAATVSAPMDLAELHRRAHAKLGGGEQRVLEHLLSIYPDATTRADAGAAVGLNLTGGSGSTYVGHLVGMGFVEIPRAGSLRAGHILFPEGLR